MILIIIAGSGALKQVLSDSGISTEIADYITALMAITPFIFRMADSSDYSGMHRFGNSGQD